MAWSDRFKIYVEHHIKLETFIKQYIVFIDNLMHFLMDLIKTRSENYYANTIMDYYYQF